MTFKSHKSLLMLAALLFVSSAQAATKLYTDIIVSTNGTVLYEGETAPNRLGIDYTKERNEDFMPGGGLHNFINYYVDGDDGKKYYALAGAVREDDQYTGELLSFPDVYTRIVDGKGKHYAYSYKDNYEFLDWTGYLREYSTNLEDLNYGTYLPNASTFTIMATNKWDIYDTMVILIDQVPVVFDAPAFQTFKVDYECTINYNGGDGADGSMASMIVTNEVTVASNEFTKIGHTFTNWWWGGKAYYAGDIVSNLTSDVTFEARWTANTYTVTLDPDVTGVASTNVVATYGKSMPQVTKPEREGYDFDGYFTGKNGAGTQYYYNSGSSAKGCDFTEDTTLYAKWVAGKYYITFALNNGSGSISTQKNYGDPITAPEDPTLTGCTFAGWSPEVPSTVPASNATYTAQWTTNTYQITFDANGGSGGIVTNLLYGSIIIDAAPEVSRVGYKFDGWQPALSNSTTVPAGDTTYMAQWVANSLLVYFHLGHVKEGDEVMLSDNKQEYLVDLPYSSFPTATRKGWFFNGWWTDFSGGTRVHADDIVSDNIGILYAHWIKDERFEITFDPMGGELTPTNVVVYTNGVAYSWLPTPQTTNNLIFAGWWTSTNPTERVQHLANTVATNAINKLYARWKEMPDDINVVTVVNNKVSITNVVPWGVEFRSITTNQLMELSQPTNGNSLAWWRDASSGTAIADDFVITNELKLTRQYTNTEISNVVKIPELAFELENTANSGDWSAQGGVTIKSGSMPKDYGTSSLIAYMKAPGTIGFDYYTELSSDDYGNAVLRLHRDEKWRSQEDVTGTTNGYKCATATNSVKWEVARNYVDNNNNYAILSNITYSANSADISAWKGEWSSTNSVDSTLKLGTAPECGVLTFEWRVNGETGYTDTNGVYRLCDYLKLYDESGNILKSVEGFMGTNATDFVTVTITNNTPVAHTFSWRYVKDYDVNAGDDGAWVKNITWTPTATTPTESTVEYEYESPDGTKQTLTISVPNDWVDEYELNTGESDYFAALTNLSGKADCNGVKLPYWADYIFGTDPTNSASVFTVTNISVAAGVVTLQWTPNLGDRDYKVWGKTNLLDAVWHSPTNSSTRFFMVEVSLPEQK